MRLWRRFQIWRGMRLLARSNRLAEEAIQLRYDAGRLIGHHAKPPQTASDTGESRDGGRQ